MSGGLAGPVAWANAEACSRAAAPPVTLEITVNRRIRTLLPFQARIRAPTICVIPVHASTHGLAVETTTT